jgi:hypothetical protein
MIKPYAGLIKIFFKNLSPLSRAPAYFPSFRRDLQGRELEHGVSRADGSVPGRQRYRRAWGSLPIASGPLRRRRGSTPAPIARCTGGWWVHGSKGRPRPFRLRVPGNAGSAAARSMNKTWHCHGAAKAASEIENDKSERPRRPVPCLIGATDSRSARRPPIASAVSAFFAPFFGATDSRSANRPVADGWFVGRRWALVGSP